MLATEDVRFGGMASVPVQILAPGAPRTPLGQLLLAGELRNSEPTMPRPLRVLDAYVLSVVTEGHGRYQRSDGTEAALRPGSHVIVPPGRPTFPGSFRRAAE